MNKKKHKGTSGKKPAKRASPLRPYEEVADTYSKVEEASAVYLTNPPRSVVAILEYLGGKSLFLQSFPGLRNIHDLIAVIRKGITRQSLDHLMDETGITPDEMAAIMHTSSRNLRRYTADMVLNPEQSERAIELARLYSKGAEVFGSSELFKSWMERNVLALGNKRPKEFLDTSLGIDMLMNELGRIEYGVFA